MAVATFYRTHFNYFMVSSRDAVKNKADELFAAIDRVAMRSALTSTFALTLAVTAAMYLHLPNGFWAAITVLVLSGSEMAESLTKAALRIAATLLGAAIGLWLVDSLGQQPGLSTAALFVVITAGAWWSFGPVFPYAGVIASVTVVMVAMLNADNPAASTETAMMRVAEITTGIVSFLISVLIFRPTNVFDRLPSQLADTIQECASLIRSSLTSDDSTVSHAAKTPLFTALARTRKDHQAFRTHMSGVVSTSVHRRVEALLITTENLVADTVLIGESLAICVDDRAENAAKHRYWSLAKELAQHLDRIRDALLQWHPAQGVDKESLPNRFFPSDVIDKESDRDNPTSPELQALSLGLHRLSGDSTRFLDLLADKASTLSTNRTISIRSIPRFYRIDTQPAFDWLRLIHAIKVAIALTLTFWFMLSTHLQPFSQAMITIAAISQLSPSGTIVKAKQRLTGVISGSLIGLFAAGYLIPSVSTLSGFLSIILPVWFSVTLIMAAYPRYSYAAMQMLIAFAITIIVGVGPSSEWTGGLMRAVGVVAGSWFAIIVAGGIARTDPLREAERACSWIFQGCAKRLRAAVDGANSDFDERLVASNLWARDRAFTFLGEIPISQDPFRQRLNALLMLGFRISAMIRFLGSRYVSLSKADKTQILVVAAELEQIARCLADKGVSTGKPMSEETGAILPHLESPLMPDRRRLADIGIVKILDNLLADSRRIVAPTYVAGSSSRIT